MPLHISTYHNVVTRELQIALGGDGDSLDRERVRDILLDEYNYKFVEE